MRTTRMVIGVVLGAVLGGCESSEPLAPEDEGEIQIEMQGDGAAESGPSRSLVGSGSASAEGSVAVRARVYLWAETGEWVEVTRGAARQTVRVDGRDGAQAFASGTVESGTYGRVRVEFEEVRATLTGGGSVDLSLGAAEVGVQLGTDERVVVERELSVRVRSGARTQLMMNLNADRWLAQVDAGTRTVAEESFAGAVTITSE